MEAEAILTRLRGAFKNAVLWGGAWFTLAAAVAVPLRLSHDVSVAIALADAVFIGTKVGVIGGIAGGAFAGLVSVFYRGQRLSEISWLRFGVGGAIMAGLFVPSFLLVGNLMSGDGLSVLPFIIDDGIMAAVFGGITAAGSMKLAQRAEALPGAAGLGQLDGGHGAATPGVGSAAYAPPRRAAE